MNPDFDFADIIPKTEPVRIGAEEWVLRSAGAGAAILYRAQLANGATIDTEKGTVSGRLNGIIEAEAVLVAACLHPAANNSRGNGIETNPDGTLKCMPLERLKELPPRLMSNCYTWIIENSDGLRERPETVADIESEIAKLLARKSKLAKVGDAAKNEQGAGTA